ncbi:MAG: hypothetical protein AABX50_00435 [Nanoarchaeota archaeon]
MEKGIKRKIKKIGDEFLDVHFYYEVMHLRECYFIIKSGNLGNKIESTPNLLIVAFSTHARNLIEFFNYKKKTKITAIKYVKTLTKEKVKNLFPKIDEYNDILCQNHSHLHYRTLDNKGISPFEITFPTYINLRKILIKFLKGLPKKYKSENMNKLLEYLEQE